jgi:hypothetical protein
LPHVEGTLLETRVDTILTLEQCFDALTGIRAIHLDHAHLLENEMPRLNPNGQGGGQHQRQRETKQEIPPPKNVNAIQRKSRSQQKKARDNAPEGQYYHAETDTYKTERQPCNLGSKCVEYRAGRCSEKFHREPNPVLRKEMYDARYAAQKAAKS